METKNYECKICGCKEFVTSPNRYDIYEAEDDKIVFMDSEFVDEKLVLYCRDCSEELLFGEDDVILN